MTFSTRQKPAEHVRTTFLCALFAGVEVAFLASVILGSSVVFGQEKVFVQEARTHQQRAGELAWPDDSKTLLKQFGAALSRVPEVVRHQLIKGRTPQMYDFDCDMNIIRNANKEKSFG